MGTAFFVVSKVVGALIHLDTWAVISLGAILIALFFERLQLAKTLGAVTFAVLTSWQSFLWKFQAQHPEPAGHRMLRWTDEAGTSAVRNEA